MRRRKFLTLIPGTAACLVMLLELPGCPPSSSLDEIASRPGNSGFRNVLLGEERLVSLEEGSLSEEDANGTAGRLNVLDTFLHDYAAEFGVLAANAAALKLIAAAPEQPAVVGDGETHQTVFLHQEHMGALVLDAALWGEFVGPEAAGSKLRRVQGRLFDPLTLTPPVLSNTLNFALANRQFREFLATNELSGDSMSLLPTPVILGEENFTGFLGHYTLSHEDGSMERLSVVVNPLTEEIHVIYSMPACRAHNALGDAS